MIIDGIESVRRARTDHTAPPCAVQRIAHLMMLRLRTVCMVDEAWLENILAEELTKHLTAEERA